MRRPKREWCATARSWFQVVAASSSTRIEQNRDRLPGFLAQLLTEIVSTADNSFLAVMTVAFLEQTVLRCFQFLTVLLKVIGVCALHGQFV